MNRFLTFDAVALRVRAQGEANREAFFLTAEEGVVRAMIYGGPKSRLRAHVAPFHSGVLYLYHDPVRDSFKVTDFDVKSWKPGLRELYERTMAAAAVAETALASAGGAGSASAGNLAAGGLWREAFSLLEGILSALAEADATLTRSVLVCFFWRWIGLLGIQPDLANPGGGEEVFRYPAPDEGTRKWLSLLGRLEPLSAASIARCSCAPPVLAGAARFCTSILAAAIGRRLASWDTLAF